MKKIEKIITLLTLTLALLLSQVAFAEPSEALQGIYDALVAEGSAFDQMKVMYAEYMPDATFDAALDGDSIVISFANTGNADGSWSFTQDGDYLTTSFATGDMNGAALIIYMVQAIGDYYDMSNASLMMPYVNGLGAMGLESDNLKIVQDEAGETVSLYIAGPWDMKELDEMVLSADTLSFDALSEDFVSCASSAGKVMLIGNGDVNDFTILLGEFGGLDDLAYQSLMNAVAVFQPKGWESFTESYTELAEADADGYTVALNVDEATVGEIIDDVNADYSYAVIHFGE